MEKDIFIDSICRQLQKMSADQKDEWILTRAKLVSESGQQDFMMSLTGEKIITYMPTETEIEAFCESVRNGDIYVEYETHYCEFDSDGRYMGDWIIQHNDPQDAFSFLDRAFRGCHDLVHLGEYDFVARILDKICRVGFQVVEAEDSEDFVDDSPFTIVGAEEEQLLSMELREIGHDWILALLLSKENHENIEFARKLIGILQLEMCKEIQISDFNGYISDKLLELMEKILEEDTKEIDKKLERISDRTRQWHECYTLEGKRARNQHLVLNIRKKCRNQQDMEEAKGVSVLKSCWEQIGELFEILRYERYIDDQLEIGEVWNICESLIKRGEFEKEDWAVRKRILEDMIAHEYYDCYGCYDPVKELADKLYTTKNEILEFADMLNKYDYYAREAAELYRQNGRVDLYIRYLETHLDKSSREYIELIQCYCNDGNEAGARQVAERGLEKCKDDLTELFIYLLKDAKKCGDKEKYKKLLASAKRRRMANFVRINEAILE